ncbi:MAG: hypothetical protein A3C61_03850 [Candidatus Yanofskybacteria bacterium RIFCSPHIGHO2_02_FULL_39_10]|uniref:HTH arsR-type domain-containing protein n=1 Tax=Candidatus Yanofskybacteria bacterium RIFCSPHIGHO2_02_FULL_39_10 TaxID=1802674 RepID=A0A1F8F913_9BACT|nr:MAG: hypothetical protein A3C61_03850 [Candidatus Yanofskybacteria bacterium RIFCSPHIGHO2_02_FULL_39_10]
MDKKRFWKTFVVVFIIAFAANILTAYLWSLAFPNSPWSWDTTTTTAGMIALIVAYVQRHDGKIEADKKQDKVLNFLKEKGEITNDDVEKALGVSDATATRYLDYLQKQGLIVQIGKEGRFVKYRLK